MTPFLMNWKSTVAVSGVTLVATWLGWMPTRQAPIIGAPSATADVQPADARDIQEQAARLQTWVRGELDYQNPKRNPFRFIARPVATVERSVGELTVTPPVELRDVVPFALSGMAADIVDGRPVRTAILTTPTDVLFAKEGDRVGAYTVTSVDETGVDLTADDGVVRRLPFIP
jgi:hypothetical protein